MRPLLKVALCCAGLLSSSIAIAADTNMSPEERTVRMAYAKIVFAVQVQSVEQAVHQKHRKLDTPALNSALDKNDLRITLSNFTVGNLSDIVQRDIRDLVTLSNSEGILSIASSGSTFKEHGKVTEETGLGIPVWTPGSGGPEGQSTVSATLAEVLAVNQPTDAFQRYAMYNVAVSFQGKNAKYRALVLFGKDANGADKVLVTDTVLGAAPQEMMRQSVYPAVLLGTSQGEVPAVISWFETRQMPASSCVRSAPGAGASQDVCCDLNAMKCGISADDLKRSAAYALAGTAAEN
jgi:hypothetical protein